MKILYFHQHFSTPAGSSGIRSYRMARKLLEYDHQVTMVCGSYGGGKTGLNSTFVNGRRRGIVDGIDVIEFDLLYSNADGFIKRATTFISFALRSIGLVFSQPYDLVFATTTPLTAGIPGIFARWFRRKPFVFEVRDLWPELPKAMGVIRNPLILSAMSLLEWATYHSASSVIALAPGIVDGVARRGISRNRISLIPNGCDLNIFANPPPPWRPKGVPDENLMAVFTGTHGPANGLDAVLDAAAELKRRQRTDISLVLIGEGKLKASLQTRAEQELLDNVIFHEPVDKQQLAGLLAAADLGMQILANVPAFYFGTSPNKFFDYIAAGLPVLNNYPGWLAELIEQHQCGFVVPPDDPAAFADGLVEAADNRDALTLMGNRGQALARTHFDRENLATTFVEQLEAISW